MAEEGAERPRQVTMGGWLTVVAATLVLVRAFQTVATLHTLDMRESIEKWLAGPEVRGLGIGVDQAISALRVVATLAAVVAVVAVGLGLQSLRRSRRARVGLSVVSVPMLVLATLVGGGGILNGFALVAGTVMLWMGPARDWFAGRPVRVQAARPGPGPGSGPGSDGSTRPSVADIWHPPSREADPVRDAPAKDAQDAPEASAPVAPPAGEGWPGQPGRPEQPPPSHGYGSAPARPTPVWGPTGSPGAGSPPPAYSGGPQAPWPRAEARPSVVMAAAIVTWVFAGVTGAFALLGVVAIVLADDAQIAEAVRVQSARLDLSPADFRGVVLVGGLAVAVICALACVFAVLVVRRSRLGRIGLAATALLGAVLGVGVFPLSVLHLVAAALVLVLLFLPDVNAWFRDRPAGGPPPPSPPPAGPGAW